MRNYKSRSLVFTVRVAERWIEIYCQDLCRDKDAEHLNTQWQKEPPT